MTSENMSALTKAVSRGTSKSGSEKTKVKNLRKAYKLLLKME
jgi:hypothetical protein